MPLPIPVDILYHTFTLCYSAVPHNVPSPLNLLFQGDTLLPPLFQGRHDDVLVARVGHRMLLLLLPTPWSQGGTSTGQAYNHRTSQTIFSIALGASHCQLDEAGPHWL